MVGSILIQRPCPVERAEAHHDPEQDADGTDDRALDEEDPADGAGGHPHGPENADFPGLFRDDHRERADDVEGGNDHDEEDDQPHRELLEFERAEERRVLGLPIERAVGIAEPLLEPLGDLRRRPRVVEPHLQPGHGLAQPGESWAISREMTTNSLSYSNMPVSNTPVTSNRQYRGPRHPRTAHLGGLATPG